MSRHIVPALDDRFTVTVGWDNPMHTFFAQVTRESRAENNDNIILWLGGEVEEVRTPEDLRQPLAAYATLSDEIIQQLHADRAACADQPPTPLQRRNLNALLRLR